MNLLGSALPALVVLLLPGLCFAAELTDRDLAAGRVPKVGDTVTLSDFRQCFPRLAVSSSSTKGKWWLRPYTANGERGQMLCVEERDLERPESCLAPALTYPLALSGTYDLWVGTYRPDYGGGVDVKLTRDKVYATIDPWQAHLGQWPPPAETVERLVEVFWKTADLTGQSLQLRQPHGTYQSLWWGLCNAHVAYVKLVRRDPREVARQEAARRALPRKTVILDRDGMSHVWMWGTEDVDCILQQVEQLQYGNVEALNWCQGTTFATNFPHPMSTGFRGYMELSGRLGDARYDRVDRSFRERQVDVLQLLVDRCHEMGVKVYVSERTSEGGHSDQSRAHPEWFLKAGPARGWSANYALPEVRGFIRDMMLYTAENYDIDGITMDFSRCRYNFEAGEEKTEYMTALLRDLRAGLDRIGKQRGRPLALNASFVCGTWYEGRTPEQQGFDPEGWVREGLVDCLMPEGQNATQYIAVCRGTKTRCCPRYSNYMDFAGNMLMPDLHDPTAEEDKADKTPYFQLSPLQIAAGALEWYDAGADGIFLFNLPDAWTGLRNLPYPSLLRQEIAAGQAYGLREGPRVEWAER
ncbi:MAG: hypothetical protein HPY69_03410 [Armatimonadetes bacterium]|nr:hypothetical protein [Armatimonadota bacterium]